MSALVRDVPAFLAPREHVPCERCWCGPVRVDGGVIVHHVDDYQRADVRVVPVAEFWRERLS